VPQINSLAGAVMAATTVIQNIAGAILSSNSVFGSEVPSEIVQDIEAIKAGCIGPFGGPLLF
jgi:hypothetical protein